MKTYTGSYNSSGYFPYRPASAKPFRLGSSYGDIRLNRRLSSILDLATSRQCLTINQLSCDHAEREAFYRLMKNDKLKIETMLSELIDRTASPVPSKHLLLVSDTSKFLYYHLKGRLRDSKGLGRLTNRNFFGYWLHASMGLDATTGFPVGIYDAQIWHIDSELPAHKSRNVDGLPFEQKSSYRWAESVLSSRKRIDPPTQITVVSDRESDIYESMCLITSVGANFVIRSQHNRNIEPGPGKLVAFVDQLPVSATLEIDIHPDPRKGTQAYRRARLELRYSPVTFIRGRKAQSSRFFDYPPTFSLYVIDIREMADTPQPVHWRLLTSHPIESVEDAQTIIGYYKQRWHIEQLFRTMKNKGLQTEALTLERGESIIRMGVVALEAAMRIMQLNFSMETTEKPGVELVFTPLQIRLLEILCNKYQGRTQKQKNPYPPAQLAWGAWVIARIGGWKGYASQHKPGPITFKIGWQRFLQIFEGYQIFDSS